MGMGIRLPAPACLLGWVAVKNEADQYAGKGLADRPVPCARRFRQKKRAQPPLHQWLYRPQKRPGWHTPSRDSPLGPTSSAAKQLPKLTDSKARISPACVFSFLFPPPMPLFFCVHFLVQHDVFSVCWPLFPSSARDPSPLSPGLSLEGNWPHLLGSCAQPHPLPCLQTPAWLRSKRTGPAPAPGA